MEKKNTRRKCSYVARCFLKLSAVCAQVTVSCHIRTYDKSIPYRAPVCTIVMKKCTPEVTASTVSKAYLVKVKNKTKQQNNHLMHTLAADVNIVLLLLVVPNTDRDTLMQVIQ